MFLLSPSLFLLRLLLFVVVVDLSDFNLWTFLSFESVASPQLGSRFLDLRSHYKGLKVDLRLARERTDNSRKFFSFG